MNLNVLLVDNYDSFTYNLVDEFRRRGASVAVWRNNIPADEALDRARALSSPRLVVLSPGPGAPGDAGCSVELIRLAAKVGDGGATPIFGVCLGLQAIVEAYGGTVGFAGEVLHGKPASITHSGEGLLEGFPSPMRVARYHSLAASVLPDSLRVTARCGNVVMAVEHREHPVFGVQFHPESILTPMGGSLIERVGQWAANNW